MVVVGALVAGAFFVGTQEQRAAESTGRLQQSFQIAEAGAAEVISKWDVNRGTYNSLALYPGDSAVVPLTTTPNGTGSYGGYVFKLNNNMYLIDITARDTMTRAGRVPLGGAQARIGVLARIRPLTIDAQAAFTVGGPVDWGGGNVFVKGADAAPTGWPSCPGTGPAIAGVRARNAGDIGLSGGQYTGSPNSIISPSMDSMTFVNFGGSNYYQLASQGMTLSGGTVSPAPVVAGGVCNKSVFTNWGDGNNPALPCGSYFPIIHLTGNTTISGGQGQGILLADADLTFAGPFTFYGLIVVRGKLATQPGASVKVFGNVLAQMINLGTTAFNGDITIQYSSCAMLRAQQATGVTALNRSRAWTMLY
jgi:hypothetical protein